MNSDNLDKTLILIPARMASTRLPGKPLADICGLPMIVQVALRARDANAGRIVVAVDHQDVFDTVIAAGFEAVMTRVDHQSGSDRIHEALLKSDPQGKAGIIINVQGDLPTIEPDTIRAALRPLENPLVDIGTLTVEIEDEEEKRNPNVVKVVGSPLSDSRLRALYFTRTTAPHGNGPLYHHIGLYAYRRAALEKIRLAAAVRAGKARIARAIAGARSGHADRCGNRQIGAARCRYPCGP